MLGSSFTPPHKRKRSDSDSIQHPNPARLKLELPSRPMLDSHEQQSPRTAVSRVLDSLSLDLHATQARARAAEPQPSSQQIAHSQSKAEASGKDGAVLAMGHGSMRTHQLRALPANAGPQSSNQNPGMTLSSDGVPTPTTDASASTKASGTILPDDVSVRSPTADRTRRSRPQSITPKKMQHVDPPLGKPMDSNRVIKSRKRRSPPPSSINDLVWSDTEITGHDPTDPDDDMYGINGVGFKLTPAMEESKRAQRRKQIAEWRKREENDRRSRRQKARNQGGSRSDGIDDVDGGGGKKVRFAQE